MAWPVFYDRPVGADGAWSDGLLDAKVDGDAASLGQRPLCVLPVVCRLWATVRILGNTVGLQCWRVS